MKNLTLLSLAFVLVSLGTANATIRRVNNNLGSNAPYPTIQAAHNAATTGDTIHVEASATGYAGISVTKQLVFIGPGYFLGENANLQATNLTASIGGFDFQNGSQGSIAMGLTFNTTNYISTSNITIRRNNGGFWYLNNYGGYAAITNTAFVQNYGLTGIQTYYSNHTPVSNTLISNNYLVSTGIYMYQNMATNTMVQNNVINASYLHVHGAFVINNILVSGSFEGSNNTVQNNLSNSTQFSVTGNANNNSYSNNLLNQTMSNVFQGITSNSTDGQWRLKTGSPALGAGLSGVDAGMFGNSAPYVLSGIPAVPAIYFLNVPVTGTSASPLNVTLKVRSNN